METNSKMTEIESLFCEINKYDKYPLEWKMKKVCGEIKGFSFFPGGKGIFYNSEEGSDKSETISDKEYMILGNDWGTLKYYDSAMNEPEPKKDPTDPTSRNLLKLLKQVEIKPENCFFTNAILGVRTDREITAKPQGNEEFLYLCKEFFKKQVSVQRPKAIFVLGKYPAKFLATLNDKLNVWEKFPNFKTIDEKGDQIIKNVQILPDLSVNFVLLVHPCWSHVAVKGRRYFTKEKTYIGNDAEVEMIKEVMK